MLKRKLSIILIIIIILVFLVNTYNILKLNNELTYSSSIVEPEYEEVTIYSSATPLDDIYEKLDISLSINEIPTFLDSSSCTDCMDLSLLGAIFTEKIPEEYKIIYAVSRATSKAFTNNKETMSDNYGYLVSLKKSTIILLAKQIFKEVTIPDNYSTKYNYYNIENFVCKKDTCYYNYIPFTKDITFMNGYKTKIIVQNNLAILNYLYINYNHITEEQNILNSNIYLYDTYNGKEIEKVENYTFYNTSNLNNQNIFNIFSHYYDYLPSYEYTFNENNILISVKKLDN